MKIILSEAQIKGLKSIGLQEIIDSDGSLVSGGAISNEKTIKTNTSLKPDRHPQMTDDFAKETAQNPNYYMNRYGFSITEGDLSDDSKTKDKPKNVQKSKLKDKQKSVGKDKGKIKELIEAEDILANDSNKNGGFMDKNSKIPDITELSKSYQKPDIQSAVTSLVRKMTQSSVEKELEQDIIAIVLKNLLTSINVGNMKPQHKKEIQNLLNNGK